MAFVFHVSTILCLRLSIYSQTSELLELVCTAVLLNIVHLLYLSVNPDSYLLDTILRVQDTCAATTPWS